jgi:nitrogen-specific signal transduction histidine kinase
MEGTKEEAMYTTELEPAFLRSGREVSPECLPCQVAHELASLKEFSAAIVEAIPSSVLVFNRDLRLIYANQVFFRVWHRPPTDLGKSLHELLPPEVIEQEGWEAKIRRVLETGEPVFEQAASHISPHRGRTVIRFSISRLHHSPVGPSTLPSPPEAFCPDSLPAPCPGHCEDCPIYAEAWQGDKALLIMDDITEQHLLQQQLIQSEKLAAMGQLSAGIAHELRNPLNAINVAAYCVADSLRDASPDLEEVQECLEVIQRNVTRAQKIITEIMQFARPSDNRSVAVDVNELVISILSILNKSFADANIEVHTSLNGAHPARCRPDTIKQALLNIIVNGIQAMPQGGTLSLRTFYEPRQGMVGIEIRDTGHGIAPENLPRIFHPFFTTKQPGEGTGLGLTIAHTAVESDGGQIQVESQPGAGSTFTVLLPAAA